MSPCPDCCPASRNVPPNTVPLTVKAMDVKEGDWLDTSDGSDGYRDPGIHRIFLDAEPKLRKRGPFEAYTLHRERTTTIDILGCSGVKVWRPVELLDNEHLRPIDRRTDRPYRNLSEVHLAGKSGALATTFQVGTYWEVGPFCEDRDPEVVQITGEPFQDPKLTNSSKSPEDATALGKRSWFVPTKRVYDPFAATRSTGKCESGGQPPHVLSPLTPRMAAKAGLSLPRPCCCCCCCCSHQIDPRDALIASLRAELRAEKERADSLAAYGNQKRKEAKAAIEAFEAISRGIYAANEALHEARGTALDQIRNVRSSS